MSSKRHTYIREEPTNERESYFPIPERSQRWAIWFIAVCLVVAFVVRLVGG